MSKPRHLALAVAFISLGGCDKPPPPPQPKPPAPITVSLKTHPDTLQITGEIEARGGAKLAWKQTVDAANLVNVVACQDLLYALTKDGRVVEWTPQTLAPKRILSEFGAVTSIDAREDVLFAGTADGRLLRSYCDGANPVSSPEPTFPALAVFADVRSKTRGFVVYREKPTKRNKFERDHATVALVDFESGRGVHEPFQRPLPDATLPIGFVDYRGELWFGMASPGRMTQIWYLERFDDTQPPLAGLQPTDSLRGFVQMSREVWAFGGSTEGDRALIYRIDSNRIKPMWDGERAWFGERPGGEIPQKSISAMVRREGDVLVVAGDGAFRVDAELRRWTRLLADDPEPSILGAVTGVTELGEKVYAATPDGMIEFDDRDWRRATVAEPKGQMSPVSPIATEVTWRGETWKVGEKAGVELAGKRFRYGPKKPAHGLFVDKKDQLWAFADDGLWRLKGKGSKESAKFATSDAGFDARLVKDTGDTDDGVLLVLSTGARFVIQSAD